MIEARTLRIVKSRRKSALQLFTRITKTIWKHPANADHRVRALIRGYAWQLRKRLVPSEKRMLVYGGMTLICGPDAGSASNIHYFGELYEYDEMSFLRLVLQPGDRVVDGGANIGTFTLFLASLVGSNGNVISFEPSPAAFGYLERNVAQNFLDWVELHNSALAAEVGYTSFTRGLDVSNRLALDTDALTDTVATTSLDNVIGDREVAFVKLDLEGAEGLALAGASDLLARTDGPIWQVELFDGQLARFGSTRASVLARFRAAGYVAARYEPSERTLQVFEQNEESEGQNLLLIPSAGLAAVAARLGQHGATVRAPGA